MRHFNGLLIQTRMAARNSARTKLLKITCSSAREALCSSHGGKRGKRHATVGVRKRRRDTDKHRIELGSFNSRKRSQLAILMRADFERPAVN